jgi:protein PhnA
MKLEEQLLDRSKGVCELCGKQNGSMIYAVPTDTEAMVDRSLFLCEICVSQLDKKATLDPNHWSFLKEVMWSEIPAVQVVAWRMLNRLKGESWANDALDIFYLEDETLEWAKATGDHLETDGDDLHRDCNGALLQTGDAVTLIKSLDVKGAQINAKIGTVVKNIRLVADNTAQIEGKIEGQQIVILTKFVRKAS